MGLAVGAACIALAVFLPGIGTVAAGALFGAGMGAISASVAGAVSDYSSGNVRSLGEATKDMVISMITGAITGAIGAAQHATADCSVLTDPSFMRLPRRLLKRTIQLTQVYLKSTTLS